MRRVAVVCAYSSPSFSIRDDKFWLNGGLFHIRSGSVHYQRIPVADWEVRLQQIVSLGLNTVETYIPWNVVERDLEKLHLKWIQLIHKVGLKVILRSGPYICGEWDYGGFPARLQNLTLLRTNYQPYLAEAIPYLQNLIKDFLPYLHQNQGPIIMIQVRPPRLSPFLTLLPFNSFSWNASFSVSTLSPFPPLLLEPLFLPLEPFWIPAFSLSNPSPGTPRRVHRRVKFW